MLDVLRRTNSYAHFHSENKFGLVLEENRFGLTVNVDIFSRVYFFTNLPKMQILRISIFAFLILLSLYGLITFIFTMYIFLWIFEKHGLCENMYNAKISTFTVFSLG